MTEHKLVYVPLAFAELLHAMLGPLEDVLSSEQHAWAPMIRRVLEQYTDRRDEFLQAMHGQEINPLIGHITYTAVEEVQNLTDDAIIEEHDFIQWASESEGETA